MSEKKNGTSHQNETKVELKDDANVQYWKYHFNCTEAELRDAVDSVGSSPASVEEYIHMLRGDKQGNMGVQG